MAWIVLTCAVIAEVTATLALRGSDGAAVTVRPWLWAVVIAGYGVAFVLLSRALKEIGVGPTYAIWSGLGMVGAAIGGRLLFAERLTAISLTGMVIVVAGVIVITAGGSAAHG